ncbi:MAG: polysaccharide biosynthesis tyrosine autokinase [Eubacterium sp.]|nr:polysaccharide biosynthesis tyrosine autokinase [Eubacterium sp.]
MNKLFDLNNIDLYSIVRDVLKRLWIVLIVGSLGVMVAFTIMRKTYIPSYTSSAIYVVNPSQSTGYVAGNKMEAESVVEVFNSILYQDVMRHKLMEDLGNTEPNFGSERSVELIEGTNLMKLTASSTDPIVSFKTVGAIMDNYHELSEFLKTDAVFDQLKAPTVARNPDNAFTPRTRSLQIGGICAFLTLLILIGVSIFRKTIKTENAVEQTLDTTLLGTIYHEKKNRTIKAKVVQSVKALLITSPIITNKFIESVNNIRMKIEYERERNPRKNTFMVTSVCENEGKSTVALNIALSLAKEGRKVILIDADMRKPAVHKMLDIPKKQITDMASLLQGKIGLDEALYEGKEIPIDIIMSSHGHSRTNEYMKSGAMLDLINKCREIADYVILDTPPMALVSDAEALLDRVDYALLVVRQDFSFTSDIANCISMIEDSTTKFIGCVLNDYKVFRANSKQHSYGYGYGYGNSEGKVVEVYEGE